jgi:hypothetical protein
MMESSGTVFGWGFLIMLIVIIVGLVMAYFGHRTEAALVSGGGEDSAGEAEKGRQFDRVLGRALRRIYRFNKKLIKDLNAAIPLVQKKNFADAKKKLKEARKFEQQQIKFDALANRAAEEIDKLIATLPRFRELALKRDLRVFNNKLKADLKSLDDKISQAEQAINSNDASSAETHLENATGISGKIVDDILALESLAEGLETELKKTK